VRGLIDDSRRPWRRERPHRDLPDRPQDAPGATDEKVTLLAVLAAVPARQRAVLVLRYYEDCDVATTAVLLGCSEGTVKSQTARRLAKLRELLGDVELCFADSMRG
jgi:RNA polymerase sigma factor (sigma-70 family)